MPWRSPRPNGSTGTTAAALSEYAGDMPPGVLEQVHYAHQQPQAAG